MGSSSVVASLSGSIWKFQVMLGDVIQAAEQVVVILEAMKTEVNIEAGEENVGLTVKWFAQEGATVSPGDVRVVFG